MHDRYASLLDRVVLITGGNRGLGREMAERLLQEGARVCLVGSGSATDVQLPGYGSDRAICLQADVRLAEDAMRAVAATIERFGNLHVLINNAGRGMRLVSESFNTTPTQFWDCDPAAWREIMEVNVDGAFHFARAAALHFVGKRFGKIINISTSEQTMRRRGYSPYGPSKAALEAASRIWAKTCVSSTST